MELRFIALYISSKSECCCCYPSYESIPYLFHRGSVPCVTLHTCPSWASGESVIWKCILLLDLHLWRLITVLVKFFSYCWQSEKEALGSSSKCSSLHLLVLLRLRLCSHNIVGTQLCSFSEATQNNNSYPGVLSRNLTDSWIFCKSVYDQM